MDALLDPTLELKCRRLVPIAFLLLPGVLIFNVARSKMKILQRSAAK